MSVLYYLFLTFFLFVTALLCFVILIQESKSMGLGASFGGDAGSSVFGTSTAEVLKKITAYLAVVFVGSCIFLSLWTNSLGRAENNLKPVIENVENTAE